MRRSWAFACAALALAIASNPEPARASGAQDQQDIAIPAEPLAAALAELSRQTGVSIGTDGRLPDLRSKTVIGHMSVGEALGRLLAGSGYRAQRQGRNAWRIVRGAPEVHVRPPPKPVRDAPVAEEFVAIEPIVVTATKQAEPAARVARSIDVYFPDGLHQADAQSGTAAVASQIDGLTLTGSGPGRNLMFLRGVADSPFGGESQSTVAVLLDGVRLTWSAPDPDLRLVDVERVEVLKGPQGTLYGQGSLGGIYQLVSRKADPSGFAAMAGGGLSALDDGAPGYSGSAMVNLPLVQDKAALRLVGYASREGGWISTGASANTNFSRTLGGRMALHGDLSGPWSLDATAAMQRLEDADSQYVYAPQTRSRPVQQAEPHDNDLNHLSLRLSGRIGSARLEAVSGGTWHEVQDSFDATVGAGQLGIAKPQRFDNDRKYRVWDNELRLSGNAHGLRWLAGISFVEARQESRRQVEPISGPAQVIDTGVRTSNDSALFANVEVTLGTGLSLEAGGRLFHGVIEDRRSASGASYVRDISRSGFTPSLALSWRPDPDQTLFVRYGSAFRQGGIGRAANGQYQSVDGDEFSTIEAGWRRKLGIGQIELSAYRSAWHDVQSDMLIANGLIETRNAGDARILGLEGSLRLTLGPGWRFGLSATGVDAKLVRSSLGVPLDDRRLPVVPSYTGRLWVERAIKFGSAEGWLRVNLKAIGPSRLSFDPAIDKPMGNYRELGAELHMSKGGWEWGVMAENVLSGRADTFALGNPLRIATLAEFTPQRPAHISAMLVRRF